MASRPEERYTDAPGWPGAFQTPLESFNRYQPARPVRIAAVPAPREWDTGLRSRLKIEFTPDHHDEIPSGLINFVDGLKRIEQHLPNWDSYQGHPLDDRVEKPAMELAILSNERSNFPQVYALPTGGLSLRWTSAKAELEIDISPMGTCEALLELFASGNEVELPRGSPLADAKALLAQFNNVG